MIASGIHPLLFTMLALVVSVGTLLLQMFLHVSPEDVFDVSMVVFALFRAGEWHELACGHVLV